MPYLLMSTRLLVVDFRACFRFYRDVLGFRPVFGSEHDSFADFDTGAAPLSLFDRHEMCEALGTSPRPGADLAPDPVCLVLAVEDVDAAWAQLERLGWRAGLGPHRLVLEITEPSIAGDAGVAHDVLIDLRRRGLGKALDDFGAGHATLPASLGMRVIAEGVADAATRASL